ncbi:MAG: beta-galactosidase [Candidatus Coatesbacteria bacterium]
MVSAAALVVAALAGATETVLPANDPAAWIPLVFVEDSGVSATEACAFTRTRDGTHDCLVIGPWIAGEWSARWQGTRPLPAMTGTLRGRYRTESVLPMTVAAGVAWLRGREKLGRDEVALESAEAWTDFAVAIRRPPPGADAVVPVAGLLEQTDGRAWFADLVFSEDVSLVAFAATPLPSERSAPPESFPPGKRFRLERSGDGWWLVTPAGRPFYSAGSDAPGFKTGAEGDALAATLRAAGFNSLGGWSNVWAWGRLNDRRLARGETPFAAFVALETSDLKGCGYLSDPASDQPPGDHAFPDPFDPAFPRVYAGLVADVARAAAGKPWLAGWFIDNERDHDRLDRRVWSGHAGRAFRRAIRAKYRTTAALNAAWGASFGSFDAAARARPVAAIRRGALYEDCRAFAHELVRRYADTCVAAIRAADPGALVFTNRFMMGGIGDTLGYLGEYGKCDGVAVNLYPANRTSGLSGNERAILSEIHRRTGKAVLIGEWSVPALDSGLYANPARLDWSYPEAVDTQVDRARQAACVTADFHRLPFVVGAHWFTWRDVDSAKRQANRGLFRSNGEPWRELLDALEAVHGRLAGVPPPP